MKHTVESLMALAFDAMDATRVWAVKNDDLTLASLGRKREALRAALTEALVPQDAQPIECECGRTHKKTPYGWASNEVAQSAQEPQPGACEV